MEEVGGVVVAGGGVGGVAAATGQVGGTATARANQGEGCMVGQFVVEVMRPTPEEMRQMQTSTVCTMAQTKWRKR